MSTKSNSLVLNLNLLFLCILGSAGSRSSVQQASGGGGLHQRRMSDESIQSGVMETQEMQTIQVFSQMIFVD